MSKRQVADLHARLTADVSQYDAEMRKAAAVTARTQQQTNKSLEGMRKGSVQFGMGLLRAGTVAVLLGNQVRRSLADMDQIPGLDPNVAGSINSARASVASFDAELKRATVTAVAFAAKAAQNIGFMLGGLVYGFDNVTEARRRMAEDAANFRPPEELEAMKKLTAQILEEREKLARFGETRSEALAHEVRLQTELADQMKTLNTESVKFKELQLQRLQAKGRELVLREQITKETGKLEKAEEKVTAYGQAMLLMFESVGDRAAQTFADMVLTGKASFSELSNIVARTMIEIVARMAIINPLMNMMFGGFTGFSTLPTFFGGGKADGGPVSGGALHLVGERGPELFKAPSSGSIIPAGKTAAMMGGKGDTYYIDATGADAAKVSQLESLIISLNGSVERRAVAAVSDATRRRMI
jgi:hypothetical protein